MIDKKDLCQVYITGYLQALEDVLNSIPVSDEKVERILKMRTDILSRPKEDLIEEIGYDLIGSEMRKG